MSQFLNSSVETIGNTPLIKLKRASEETGCTILGKAEFLNPGQSVKDRAALGIIRDAEEKGILRPGGTIVEGTAGNTGIGLAMVGRALGYKVVIVMNDTQSEEKKMAVTSFGAELIEVPQVPFADENNYVHFSRRLAEKLNQTEPNGTIWANQFDNIANRLFHTSTTGPEIWAQTEGNIDGFTCAVGTGGTLGGVSDFLKSKNKNIRTAASDPFGAKIYSLIKHGTLETSGSSITEGIGQIRETLNIKDMPIDTAYQLHDRDALQTIYQLAQEESMFLGGSSGINIEGAKTLAREMGPGHTIVTFLCDYGNRYLSTTFSEQKLRENDLPMPPWLNADMRKTFDDIDL